MAIERFPLVGSITNRKFNSGTPDTTDQEFINCFPEIITNPITKRSSVWLTKRPGATASADVGASSTGTNASVVWTSNTSAGAVDAPVVLSFKKSSAVQFFDAETLSQIGGDISTAGINNVLFLNESDAGGVGNLTAAIADSGAVEMWYFPAGGAWTQITDSDFPSSVTPLHAHLDGYMFVMAENGRIYNSDLNSLSAWTANNYITASSFPDRGVGVARYRNVLLAFGDASMEVFVNAGNPTGSVLSRAPDYTFQVGAIRNNTSAQPAIRTVGDNVYWIGAKAGTGSHGIYRMRGMRPEKISNTAVDKIIAPGGQLAICGCMTFMGMTHIVFALDASGFTLACYCVETGYWWFFQTAQAQSARGFIGAVDSAKRSKTYHVRTGDAKVYTINQGTPIWQDNSIAYTMTVRTQNMDFGTRRQKFFKSLAVIGDVQSSTSALNVSYSDNDYSSFSTARSLDLSIRNNCLMRLGSSRRRSWQFTHAANTPCRIEAVEIDYEVGSQ